jgi:hypothetical protein
MNCEQNRSWCICDWEVTAGDEFHMTWYIFYIQGRRRKLPIRFWSSNKHISLDSESRGFMQARFRTSYLYWVGNGEVAWLNNAGEYVTRCAQL